MKRYFQWPLMCALWFALVVGCAKKTTSSEDAISARMLDTLNYGAFEYDAMRSYFRGDSLMQLALKEQVAKGDENAQKLQILLNTGYADRHESGFVDNEIDALMLSFYAMKSVNDKFNRINQSLDSLMTAAEIERLRDSLSNPGGLKAH